MPKDMHTPAYTRPIQSSDLSDLADVAADCFKEDELFVKGWPCRDEYYGVYRRSWLRAVRDMLARRGAYGFVIRHLDTDELIGAAIWRRQGPETSSVARGWMQRNNDWPAVIERTLRGWEERYVALTRQESRAADLPFLERWEKACDELGNKWENTLSNRWHLHLMMVSEKYRRHGFGTKLMHWGVKQAKDENVPVALFASLDGIPLYAKHGFKEIGRVFIRTESIGETLDFGPMMVGNTESCPQIHQLSIANKP